MVKDRVSANDSYHSRSQYLPSQRGRAVSDLLVACEGPPAGNYPELSQVPVLNSRV